MHLWVFIVHMEHPWVPIVHMEHPWVFTVHMEHPWVSIVHMEHLWVGKVTPILAVACSIVEMCLHEWRHTVLIALYWRYVSGAQLITLLLLLMVLRMDRQQTNQVTASSCACSTFESPVPSCSTHSALCHEVLSEGQISWLQNSLVILSSLSRKLLLHFRRIGKRVNRIK